MKFVKIHHPQTGGEALVPETAVTQHRKAGWRLATKKTSASQSSTTAQSAVTGGADTGKEHSA
ncbi:MAG: hypothetical protein ACRDMV_18085 [Streptosporangiales bacterium]